MVLDAGRIVSSCHFVNSNSHPSAHDDGHSQVEFDKPSELLKKENGRFRSLVDNSGDKDLLYQLANKVAATQ